MNIPTILMILFIGYLLVYSFILKVKLDNAIKIRKALIKDHAVDIQLFSSFIVENNLVESYTSFYDEFVRKEGLK